MVEVAIAAVEAVFDWRAYLSENFGKVYPEEEKKTEETSRKKKPAAAAGASL